MSDPRISNMKRRIHFEFIKEKWESRNQQKKSFGLKNLERSFIMFFGPKNESLLSSSFLHKIQSRLLFKGRVGNREWSSEFLVGTIRDLLGRRINHSPQNKLESLIHSLIQKDYFINDKLINLLLNKI